MNYEQKYKEALERARKIENRESIDVPDGTSIPVAIFPELKESEDEKIRKELLSFCQNRAYYFPHDPKYVNINNWIAWLEKQGEQKPADKVEPKFKIGDWIITPKNEVLQITNIEGTSYVFNNESHYWEIYYCDKQCRLWTIEDAKDGDVLWHSNSTSIGIFIFNKIRDNGKVVCYCNYDSEDHFCLGEYHTCCWSNEKYIKPATKEQRNLLFTKMKEAGYEWDADKKELKKIEQKSVEETSCDRCKKAQPSHSCQDITELGRCYLEHEKQGEQKLIWDKFDDLMLKDMIEFIESGWSGNGKSHLIYWLKSIKDRIK